MSIRVLHINLLEHISFKYEAFCLTQPLPINFIVSNVFAIAPLSINAINQ